MVLYKLKMFKGSDEFGKLLKEKEDDENDESTTAMNEW